MAAVLASRSAQQGDPMKTAEHLFETQNIAQIREVSPQAQSISTPPPPDPQPRAPTPFARKPARQWSFAQREHGTRCVFAQVEQQMRSDIENKKQQLRLLVGDSYR